MYLATHILGSQRNGVNHVAMNLGNFNATSGPVRGTDYPLYSNALLDWYRVKNVKSVRLMFTWEATQAADGTVPAPGAGYAAYWADLTGVVTRLLARGIYVTLAPWQFNPASGDTDVVFHGAAFSAAAFGQFWGAFAAAINQVTGNDPRVAFDLMNEPHTHAESGNKPGDIGISLTEWFQCAQAAISGIRAREAANTIFVPGMAYTAASSFTTNGSAVEWLALSDPLHNTAVTVHCYTGLGSANPTVLRDACSAMVTWARSHGKKVHVGEIAIDAGSNGRPSYCGTLPLARTQWADWKAFCAANNDVLVGWNWWANSAPAWWNQGDSCDPNGFHWGLTLDDGATQTIYMDLIEATLPVPDLCIRDNAADVGSEPNVTTAVGWESPDVWARRTADGVTVGETIVGGQPSVVYVRITNRGLAASDDNQIVRLLWAKASTGLSWPAPWDGAIPKQGGEVAPAQPVGAIGPGQSKIIALDWPATPDPADYGNDGHFCLMASVTTAAAPDFAGFEGPDLNRNVLAANNVAWRNVHVVGPAEGKLGKVVVANHTTLPMTAQIVFEFLDAAVAPVSADDIRLVLTAQDESLERLASLEGDPALDNLGDGRFRVLDPATGIRRLDLRIGETLPYGLEYVAEQAAGGYAVRAVQLAVDGDRPTAVGGQTFVAGDVEGFTT